MRSDLPPKDSGLKVMFITIFEFSGAMLAVVFDYKPWELSKPESELLGTQADEVLIEFCPQVENKWAKLGMFVVSLIGIFGKKYFAYDKDLKEKAKTVPKENTKENQDKGKIQELSNSHVTVKDGI